jgi:hypothetical protein
MIVNLDAALAGLRNGDFSRLAPLFAHAGEARLPIVRWHAKGRFADQPQEWPRP